LPFRPTEGRRISWPERKKREKRMGAKGKTRCRPGYSPDEGENENEKRKKRKRRVGEGSSLAAIEGGAIRNANPETVGEGKGGKEKVAEIMLDRPPGKRK